MTRNKKERIEIVELNYQKKSKKRDYRNLKFIKTKNSNNYYLINNHIKS